MFERMLVRKTAPPKPVSARLSVTRPCGCRPISAQLSASRGVQSKLRVGAVNDAAESEADRIADRIVSMPAPADAHDRASPGSAANESRCARCEGEGAAQGPTVRAAPAEAGTHARAGPAVDSALSALSAGSPMESAAKAFFEPRFGRDFSQVRIHAGEAADAAARTLGARAFAVGDEIGFAAGEHDFQSARGRRLMAHELAHTLQQDGDTVRAQPKANTVKCAGEPCDGRPDDAGALYREMAKSCSVPKMVEALKAEHPDLFEGRAHLYGKAVLTESGVKDATKIQIGQCLSFPRDWKDPNIGDVDSELTVLNDPGDLAEKNRIIATIYAEQAGASPTLDEHRKYIFYAMLLRIQGSEWGPGFKQVVNTADFHASGSTSDSYKRNYVPAKTYLEGKSADPKRPVNSGAIDRLSTIIGKAKAKDIPKDAGPYYFHWSLGKKGTVTAENTYQAALKKGETKEAAEKKGALEQAHKALDAPASATLKKIIRGPTPAPDERVKSMYIFR